MAEPIEIDDGEVRWSFDTDFLASNWTCLWGRGCQGILDQPAEQLQQGCCSVGARVEDDDEARMIVANTALLERDRFEQFDAAAAEGVLDGDARNTRVVDGACIFFNRPGFAGGVGCALHLAALAHDESPIDWKPSVCWRLPLAIDWTAETDGPTRARVRRWERADWGREGSEMAWWCTEAAEAYSGDLPVVDAMADELSEIAGTDVYVELRRRVRSLVDGHGHAGGADVDAATPDQAPEDEVGS